MGNVVPKENAVVRFVVLRERFAGMEVVSFLLQARQSHVWRMEGPEGYVQHLVSVEQGRIRIVGLRTVVVFLLDLGSRDSDAY